MDTRKLQALVEEHGFLPDGDLVEFAEIVLLESFRALAAAGNSQAIQVLQEHFDT